MALRKNGDGDGIQCSGVYRITVKYDDFMKFREGVPRVTLVAEVFAQNQDEAEKAVLNAKVPLFNTRNVRISEQNPEIIKVEQLTYKQPRILHWISEGQFFDSK